MKLTIEKEQILSGLQAVQNVVSTRTTLPILSNVLLRAEGERLEFTATDLDVTISCSVKASVSQPGATTMPVKKLFGICRELNSPELELEVDNAWISTLSGDASEAGRVDVHDGIVKIRVVQHIDRVHPEFELLRIRNTYALDQVHVQTEVGWPLDPFHAQIAYRARFRIHQKKAAL